MTQYKDIVTAPEAVKGFYPTPPELADKLLEGVDWNAIDSVLEPSAGKGDLIKAVSRSMGYHASMDVDAIEIDPALRAALNATFSEVHKQSLFDRRNELSSIKNAWRYYQGLPEEYRASRFPGGPPTEFTPALEREEKENEVAISEVDHVAVHVIHDDFLSFSTEKRYGLIVMNPPFANGVEHLEKAIALQERYGGEIRCILNAETLKNPYTFRRQMLMRRLEELNAIIEYVDDAFSDAERAARVDVALISVKLPTPELKSDIFDRLQKAAEEAPIQVDENSLVPNELFSRYISMFNVEIKAGVQLLRDYAALAPHILSDMVDTKWARPILQVRVGEKEHPDDINAYVRAVRRKYWRALFHNPEFTGHLTTSMLEAWNAKITSMANYDFTLFNIHQVLVEMNSQLVEGVEEAIEKVFHKLTDEHAWYADSRTIHYFTGWATNKAHMVGKKAIIPANGAYANSFFSKETEFNVHSAIGALADIEKVLAFFDGQGVGAQVDMSAVLNAIGHSYSYGYGGEPIPPKNIHLKYFTVTFYKKGTAHITFHDQQLVDRLNIYCARRRNELPPNYGRVAYADLGERERAVVDSFHGDGTQGSGKGGYTTVYEHQALYLGAPKGTANLLALPG